MKKISKAAEALKAVISEVPETTDDVASNLKSANQPQRDISAEASAAAAQEKLAERTGSSAIADVDQDDPFGADLFDSPSVPTRDGDGEGLIPGTDPAELITKATDPTSGIADIGGINTDIDGAGDLVQDTSGGGTFVPNLESGSGVVETELVDRSTSPYFRETHANGSQTVTQGPTEFLEANDRALADGRPIVDAVTGEESGAVDLFHDDGNFGITENYIGRAVLESVLDASKKVNEGRLDAEANEEAEANRAADEVLFGDDNFFVNDTDQFFVDTNTDTTDPLADDPTTEAEANEAADEVLFDDPAERGQGTGQNDDQTNTGDNNNDQTNTGGNNDDQTNTGGNNDDQTNTGGNNDDQTNAGGAESEGDAEPETDDEATGGAESSASTPSGEDPTSDQAVANRRMVEEMGLNGENRTRNDNLIDPVENDEIEGEGTGYVPPISIPEQDMIVPETLDDGRQPPTDGGDIDYGPDYDDTDTPDGGAIPDSTGIHVSGDGVLAPLQSANLIADAPIAEAPAAAPEMVSDTDGVAAPTAEASGLDQAAEIPSALATPDIGVQAIESVGADLDLEIGSALSFEAEVADALVADVDIDEPDVAE